ncbi:B12-binding domain-containing radical SAM protein [Proteocatella sphenisci]|uniref:B12-binding domain-containing radical SAM protein n=1 Tax=Proteocatella sphenisci TaxID=181070 RepID=UPI00048DAAFF|nr:B12-binding domain-containing radical SAM protein [Proteocatella sphenisci]
MKILLVRPPRIKQAITVSNFMFSEPLGLEMIYGVFTKNHTVEIFDMMIEKMSIEDKISDFKPDMIGITSLCIDVLKVIDLCEKIKKCDEKIITFTGGTQALLSPESFFHPCIDYVFNYTTEDNLLKFLKMEKNIEGVYQRQNAFKDVFPKGKNQYLLPDRKSTKKYRSYYSYFGYRPAAIMEYGLGCENRCSFCLRWRIEGYKEVEIDKDITIPDLENIEEDTIMFIDNDFLASRQKLEGFLEIIRELDLKKNYIIYGSVKGVLENQDLLGEFASLGLKAILIGYETFKDEELEIYNKNISTLSNLKASKLLKSLNIDVWASFMAHPDWDKEDFVNFRKYIKKLKPQITTINPLTPFPGLPLYEEYKDRLLYKADDYEKWSFGQMIIRPSKISIRSYYYQLMITYLYVNLFINSNTDMLKKYGPSNVFRIATGAIKASKNYIRLMIKGG